MQTYFELRSRELAVYFSPRGGCTEAIAEQLNGAKKSIAMQAYSFTSTEVAKALADGEARGVKVWTVLDKQDTGEHCNGWMASTYRSYSGECVGPAPSPVVRQSYTIGRHGRRRWSRGRAHKRRREHRCGTGRERDRLAEIAGDDQKVVEADGAVVVKIAVEPLRALHNRV